MSATVITVRVRALIVTILSALLVASLAGTAGAAPKTDDTAAPPTKTVTTAEKTKIKQTPLAEVLAQAEPLPTPNGKALGHTKKAGDTPDLTPDPGADLPDGPQQRHAGALPSTGVATDTAAPAPTATAASASASTATSSSTSQNGAWPGAYYTNPNAQIGKLYFDTVPGAGVSWSHCSGTAINSENKSLVLTAGHCVFRPDPDGNGVISGNGYWYENFIFCPGYESGCRLGQWNYRQVSTTSSWFYGVNGRYDFRDDVAVVLVSPNSRGYLVNAVGGQGITFNAPTNLYRYAFGYPVTDSRWPAYSYSGEDLQYCPNYSNNDTTYPGSMWMNCTMTGGSSGGPWLSYVASNWLGYVNSVNSHKPYGGPWMNGPYFDNPESSLFAYWRAR